MHLPSARRAGSGARLAHATSRWFGAALLAFGLAGAAQAGPTTTYSFTGAVTDDPFGLSSFGATIAGSFAFDPAALDAIASAATGSFASVGTSYGFTADVGGLLYAIDGGVTLTTANDIGADQFGVIAQNGALTLELFFQDSTSTALAGDALPGTLPSITGFDLRQFRLFSDDAEFTGRIDSMTCTGGCTVTPVPEPTTAALMSCSLLALWFGRSMTARRRRD